jgi:hypothetical protein
MAKAKREEANRASLRYVSINLELLLLPFPSFLPVRHSNSKAGKVYHFYVDWKEGKEKLMEGNIF